MKTLRAIYNKKTVNQRKEIDKIVATFKIGKRTFQRDLVSKKVSKIPYDRTRIYLIAFGEIFAEILNNNFNEIYSTQITQNTFSGGGNHHNNISRVDTWSSTDVLNN